MTRFALLGALTLLALGARAQETAPSSPETQGITPLLSYPDQTGAAIVQYGVNDYRLVVLPFTVRGLDNSTLTPNAVISAAIELRPLPGTDRTRVFQWQNNTLSDTEDETTFSYDPADYPWFQGFRVSPGVTYEVRLRSRDIDDGFEGDEVLATVSIPADSAAASHGQLIR